MTDGRQKQLEDKLAWEISRVLHGNPSLPDAPLNGPLSPRQFAKAVVVSYIALIDGMENFEEEDTRKGKGRK